MNTSKSQQSDTQQSCVPQPDSTAVKNVTVRRFLTPSMVGTAALLAVATLAIVLGAGAAAATRAETTDAQPAKENSIVQRVETVELELTDDIQQSRTYTGIITARRSADVGFERSARLTAVHFDDGDVVAEGQPLATLDTRQLKSKRREIVARHQAAVALLAELNAGPRQETIDASRAQVADLKSQQELRKLTFRRTEKLRKQNAATDQDIDDSRLALKSTEAKLNVAQRLLDELEAGTRREKIEAQRANVEQLNASLEDIDIELENSVLKAPFAGRVAERYLDEGTVVAPGQPVFRIVEDQNLEARIGLPFDAVQSLQFGDSIELMVGDVKGVGIVARKLPEIDMATRTQAVVIEIGSESATQLVPGQVVHTSINQQVDQTGFLLPTACLLPGVRGLWSLFAVIEKDGKQVIDRRHVEILYTNGDQVLVRGTLAVGDRVVTSGVQRLVSGMNVELVQ